jgi:hypothetical protein
MIMLRMRALYSGIAGCFLDLLFHSEDRGNTFPSKPHRTSADCTTSRPYYPSGSVPVQSDIGGELYVAEVDLLMLPYHVAFLQLFTLPSVL